MNKLAVSVGFDPGVIRIDNLPELKEQLSSYLEDYRHAVYTEETKGFAKAAVADLRRLRKETNDAKIAAKKAYMKPCDEFESQVKELLALIDEPIALIDSQLKEFEALRIEERKTLIRQLYEEVVAVSQYAAYLPLDKIYSAKWENATTSKKAIADAMKEQVEGAEMEVESICTMIAEPEVREYALRQYKVGCTVVESMRRAKEYLDMMERKAARESEEKIIAAKRAAEKAEAEKKAAEAFLAADDDGDEDEVPFFVPDQGIITMTYTIRAGAVHIEMLEAFMAAHGIEIVRRA